MKKQSILRVLSPVLFGLALAACDSSTSEPAAAETSGGELAVDEADALSSESSERAAHRDHHRKGMRAHATKRIEALCKLVSCETEQREALLALVAREPAEASSATAAHTKIKAAGTQLAAAFRGDAFAGSDVDAFFGVLESVRPGPESEISARAAEAHAILTPEQRELVAQRVESGEFGPGSHEGHRARKRGDAKRGHERGADRAERMVARACDHLECTSEQRAAMSELAKRHHEARKARREAHDTTQREQLQTELAAMIRADTLDAAMIRAHMSKAHAARQGRHDAGKGQMAELAVDLHALLTPVQRVKVAEKIESGRMPGMFGRGMKRGHHGSRHHGG